MNTPNRKPFMSWPEGTAIPEGAHGPVRLINGHGSAFRDGDGGNGLHSGVTGVRAMQRSELHPTGYVFYVNSRPPTQPPRRGWAATYRKDPDQFIVAVRDGLGERLAGFPDITIAAELRGGYPNTELLVAMNMPGSPRRQVRYHAPLWEAVKWYEAFDSPSLELPHFVAELHWMLDDDLERAGLSWHPHAPAVAPPEITSMRVDKTILW